MSAQLGCTNYRDVGLGYVERRHPDSRSGHVTTGERLEESCVKPSGADGIEDDA